MTMARTALRAGVRKNEAVCVCTSETTLGSASVNELRS